MKFEVRNQGAELISLKDDNGREFIHQSNATWKWYSPIIFPILGKSKDNKITHQGNSFSIGQHGIARICGSDPLIDNDVHKLFEINSSIFTKVAYPFDFKLSVEYSLYRRVLYITNTVENTGRKNMYFNIGAHPGFNLFEDSVLEDYILIFPNEEKDIVFSRDISSLDVFKNNCLTLSNELICDNSLFMKNLKSRSVTLKNTKTGEYIKMDFSTDTLGVWARYDLFKPFICLEPWQTFADSSYEGELSQKPGITKLDPGEKYTFNYSIEI